MTDTLFPTGDYGPGGRGGPKNPMTVAQAAVLYEKYHGNETAMVREQILIRCHRKGEIHADDLRDLPITTANIVGAAFNTLCGQRLLFSVGRRASSEPAAHCRTSSVYSLTAKGEEFARLIS